MKKIKYTLLLLLLTFRFVSFSQLKMDSAQLQKTDAIQQADSNSNKLNPNDLRKVKDSIAKNLAPVNDKAIVYIIRNNLLEFLVPYRMDCDSFQIGWVKAGTYLYTILDPGEHVFISTPPTANEFRLKMNLEGGKIYYLELYYGVGIISTPVKMKSLDAGKGKKDLATCKIAKHNQYPLFPKSKEVENFPPDDK
jgi:hypothetical protein